MISQDETKYTLLEGLWRLSSYRFIFIITKIMREAIYSKVTLGPKRLHKKTNQLLGWTEIDEHLFGLRW